MSNGLKPQLRAEKYQRIFNAAAVDDGGVDGTVFGMDGANALKIQFHYEGTATVLTLTLTAESLLEPGTFDKPLYALDEDTGIASVFPIILDVGATQDGDFVVPLSGTGWKMTATTDTGDTGTLTLVVQPQVAV